MPENGDPIHRKPRNVRTSEITAANRHAHQVTSFYPNARLDRTLATTPD